MKLVKVISPFILQPSSELIMYPIDFFLNTHLTHFQTSVLMFGKSGWQVTGVKKDCTEQGHQKCSFSLHPPCLQPVRWTPLEVDKTALLHLPSLVPVLGKKIDGCFAAGRWEGKLNWGNNGLPSFTVPTTGAKGHHILPATPLLQIRNWAMGHHNLCHHSFLPTQSL